MTTTAAYKATLLRARVEGMHYHFNSFESFSALGLTKLLADSCFAGRTTVIPFESKFDFDTMLDLVSELTQSFKGENLKVIKNIGRAIVTVRQAN